ncbi:MAG: cell division protein FtsQ/DivIB [Ignavibacteria bacterium]
MRRYSIYLISVLFIGFIVYLSVLAKKYEPKYRVENLVIVNNHIIPTEVLLDFIQVKSKEELADLTADLILDRIEKYPYVKRVEGFFVDTVTYQVKVEEVIPFFIAVTNLGNFIVTKENKIIPEDTRLNIIDLPVLTISSNLTRENLKPNNPLFSAAFKSFENIYKTDKGLFETISEMNIDNQQNLNLYLTKPKGKILAGNEIDKFRAFYLSEFWRQIILNDPNINYDYIDLRFQNQIVVKKTSNSGIS